MDCRGTDEAATLGQAEKDTKEQMLRAWTSSIRKLRTPRSWSEILLYTPTETRALAPGQANCGLHCKGKEEREVDSSRAVRQCDMQI